jgi:hypothetical protein
MQRTIRPAIAQPVQRKLTSVAFEAVEDTNYDSHFAFMQIYTTLRTLTLLTLFDATLTARTLTLGVNK